MLIKMLGWQVGIQTDFSLSVGKNGKYLEKYLPEATWQQLMQTYVNGSYEDVWNALFTMCNLFRRSAQEVADHFQYEYPIEDDQRVTNYLKHVRALPPNATEIF